MSSPPRPLVIDVGGLWTRVGYAGDDSPYTISPSVVGRPKSPGIMVGMEAKEFFPGWEAIEKRGILKCRWTFFTSWRTGKQEFHPEGWQGVVRFCLGENRDWGMDILCTPEVPVYSDLEKRRLKWGWKIDKRRCQDGQRALITEFPGIPEDFQTKKAELIFEKLKMESFYAANSSVLSLYASGRTTGVVLSVGDLSTTACAVEDGVMLQQSLRSSAKLSGSGVTDYLVKILSERGYEMTTSAEREVVIDIKHKLCYVAQSYVEERDVYEMTGVGEREYVLPDSSKMTVGNERLRAPELLFQPAFAGIEQLAVHKLVGATIAACDPKHLQPILRRTVVLAGGSTMFRGFPERLQKEIEGVIPSEVRSEVKVIAPAERKFSSWIGGSMLASSGLLDKSWITAKEYADVGPSILQRKKGSFGVL